MKSWFAGTASSINSEIVAPFSNAEQIIYKYNQAIEYNSLTQQGWQRLIAQCDDGLAAYLSISLSIFIRVLRQGLYAKRYGGILYKSDFIRLFTAFSFENAVFLLHDYYI